MTTGDPTRSPQDATPAPNVDRPAGEPGPPPAPRPWIERLGLAAIALVLAILFGAVALAAFVGGELFLAGMGAIGALMTLWVGGATLVRG